MHTHLSKKELTKKIKSSINWSAKPALHLEKATDPADWASPDIRPLQSSGSRILNTFKVKDMICCSHIIFLSFLHQVSPPCQQTGVASGLPCIFPFTYKGKGYQCCSTEDEPNNRPWCPLVHTHFYTGQAGFSWDYCRKFIHNFGGFYRYLKTRINNARWDILTENEKLETFAKWMPDSTPFFVVGVLKRNY